MAQASAVFLQQTWQQQPALFKATPQRKALLAGVADKAAILALVAGQAEAGKPLEYGEDVLAGCCGGEGHHGHSHHHHGSEEGTAHAHPVGEATGEAMERLLRWAGVGQIGEVGRGGEWQGRAGQELYAPAVGSGSPRTYMTNIPLHWLHAPAELALSGAAGTTALPRERGSPPPPAA